MKQELFFHKPVLVDEVITYLDPQPESLYIDVTFGSGGHTKAILQAEPQCKVFALDWDKESLETYAPLVQEQFPDRFSYAWGNFARVREILKKHKIKSVDGILADFGTSQMQIMERAGFSFSVDSPLDMRMSPAHQKITAEQVVNYATEPELRIILREYGEEYRANAIIRALVEARKKKKIVSTKQLADIITSVIPRRKGHIHPATKTFQALRIYVNRELENIHSFLQQAFDVLKPGARLLCISFHSLEDRLVKQFYKDKEQEKMIEIITKKPLIATEEELRRNPSSRSAKLRVAQRVI